MAQIVIEHLSKSFRGPHGEQIRAVDDLSLVVDPAELVTLVGPSGCGKTTTLRLVSGLDQPSSGSITIDGQLMNGVAAKNRDIAMVYQKPALYPHLTARENIAFGLTLRNCPRAELDRRVAEAVEMLQLRDCLQRRPSELSGGESQRVALGRAMVRRPKVFLFDEPLANLDPQMRVQLRNQILRLHRQLAATVLYVTHDNAEAMMLGSRVAVMKRGTIQQVGTRAQLGREPANLFVASFINSPSLNFFEGTLATDHESLYFDEKAECEGTKLEHLRLRCPLNAFLKLKNYIGKKVTVAVRPGDIRCITNSSAEPSENIIEGVIELLEPVAPGS